MPIYEYKCNKCSKEFEELVFGDAVPDWPVLRRGRHHPAVVLRLSAYAGAVARRSDRHLSEILEKRLHRLLGRQLFHLQIRPS